MNKVILHIGKKTKKTNNAPVGKKGVIYSLTNIKREVNNRVAQPATETNMQKNKEGTAESMFVSSGGFERF
jgi:hypothetical protein